MCVVPVISRILELIILGTLLNNGLVHGQVNIALDRPANSSSVFSEKGNTYGPASKVVDGNTDPFLDGNSCLLTDRITTSLAWLWIDLGNTSVVQRIELTNRKGGNEENNTPKKDVDHKEHLKGFAMAVSNTTQIPPVNSDVCYSHPGNGLPAVFQNRTCKTGHQIGRYVIIYNTRQPSKDARLEICEVKVIGCFAGYYGKNCSSPCGHCIDGQCMPNNGSCMLGCTEGYRWDRCTEECFAGYYGKNCLSPCGHCIDGQCMPNNGSCMFGCTEGYHGDRCTEECFAGYYGKNCSSPCGHCIDGQCLPNNGSCMLGCTEGYRGDRCTEECDKGSYGMHCDRICGICDQNETCNHITGSCTNGCASGHSGQKCTRVNLAFGRPTAVSGNSTNLHSDVTVDGNKTDGQCITTSRGAKYAWWRVDLGRLAIISHVTIDITTSNKSKSLLGKRLHGFEITVSEEELSTESDVCYTDRDPRLPNLIQNRTCEMVGRYVEISIDRRNGTTRNPNKTYKYSINAVLELCEVQVTGCVPGSYGENCELSCPAQCTDNMCFSNATCVFGCDAGYQETFCNETCENGYFGINCQLTCGHCLNSRNCNPVNGVCPLGCETGWISEKCKTPCTSGYYGANCTEECGSCVNYTACNHTNGVCHDGCASGFKTTPSCQEKCENHTFGLNCSQSCGTCRNESACEQTTGICTEGCDPGWQEPYCNAECLNHTYGHNCSSQCGHCRDGVPCNVTDGRCLDICEPGWQLPNCEIECENGTFGTNCTNTCGKCEAGSSCDNVNGACTEGCEPGWQPPMCITECQTGFYGDQCHEVCGACVNGTNCHHVNGTCEHGCDEGWQGNTCDKECDAGFYWENCEEKCGNCKHGTTCNRTDGKCPDGCDNGWKGQHCDEECQTGFYGDQCHEVCGACVNGTICHHVNGTCEHGCDEGWQGNTCDKECDAGFYWENCEEKCGNCKHGTTCNRTDGKCPDGCDNGWKGQRCDEECQTGFYGDQCHEVCGACVNGTICHYVNGTCEHGCDEGWQGNTCDKECDVGFYWENCEEKCGNCKHGTTCNRTDGKCPDGCDNGWKGQRCDEVCDPFSYGASCSSICGHCLHTESCNHISGMCANGCENGWMSQECDQETEQTSSGAAIGAGVGSSVVVVLVVIGITIFYVMKRRSSNPPESEELVGMPTVDIPMFLSKKLHSNELHEEFKQLPGGAVHACDAGQRPENKSRNRFLTTFPYDHSRVILRGEGNDYINANYIDSLEKKNAYVATQGPKKNTLGDFWAMLWQNKSDKIIMLANCIEMGKPKVEQYWPDKGHSRDFGDYRVVTTNEQIFAAFTVRTLSLYGNTCQTPMEIMQFHFTKWPDHGTPDIIHLVNFYRHVQSTKTKHHGPMVVHCSAGIGRTGTFIAIDALVHYGTLQGNVDPLDYAKLMRQNRMNMIQTKEQYVAVHEVLLDHFICDDFTLTIEEFQDDSENMSGLQDEFMTLSKYRPNITLKESSDAMSEENISKNKDLEIIPANRYRPYLMSQSPDRTNYINAVIIPSCKTEIAFLVTQMPNDDTLDEFWAMVFDYQSTAILILDPDSKTLPSQSRPLVATRSFSVQHVPMTEASDNYEHVRVQNIAVVRKGHPDSFLTSSFEVTRWPNEEDQSVSPIIKANYAVQSSQYGHTSPGPVTVVCRNGSDRCGVFCAVSNAAECLNMNRTANVFLTIRQLQYRRPSFIRTLHDYELCYRAVAAHCETISDYGNV
ncbi:multiple epidermal growth factor-like domains protein 6 isoform X2 [Mizuhopecten yessoensis]|uniref:multiple epidermal growth factor-like domains protein 6 isoform X2 n=1 Tax=Mizuhopecten yessoensis TaxID=6573 RepID=UPI000B457491|nr:multiple epidermal growth factor-like domains protein 6 isoform X2 [Mizuhopecten yessoensis]